MREARYLVDSEVRHLADEPEIREVPIRVAEDWYILAARADRTAEVIDRHLEFESKLQGRDLRPCALCPEQKVSLVSDLTAV